MHALNVYSLCFFYTFFFIGNQVATSLTLKVKQLAKQLPSLKTLLKKISVELWVKKFYFFKYKFTDVKFLYNCFWHKLIVYYTIPANIRLNEDVLKTSLKTSFVFVFRRMTSSRCLDQDEYVRRSLTSSEDVFKTSWSRPISSLWPYVFKTSSRCFEDVFKTSSRHLQDVFKTFWRRL